MNASRKSNVTWKNVPTRTITAGGIEFAYRELGTDNPGTPVVFLIHLAAVLDNWDPRIVDGFAARHRVITFDNRGIGASTGTPATSMEEMAGDAITFIKAMGLDQVDLAGFSMGGMIAQEIVLMEPQLVQDDHHGNTPDGWRWHQPSGSRDIPRHDPGLTHLPGPEAVSVLHPDAIRNSCRKRISEAPERALRKPRQAHHRGSATGSVESAAQLGREGACRPIKSSSPRSRGEWRQ